MLSNAYFLAKFRFDTAENEPAKNLQNFRKMHFQKMHFQKMHFRKMHFRARHRQQRVPHLEARLQRDGLDGGDDPERGDAAVLRKRGGVCAAGGGPVPRLVERSDIELFSDFSAK